MKHSRYNYKVTFKHNIQQKILKVYFIPNKQTRRNIFISKAFLHLVLICPSVTDSSDRSFGQLELSYQFPTQQDDS